MSDEGSIFSFIKGSGGQEDPEGKGKMRFPGSTPPPAPAPAKPAPKPAAPASPAAMPPPPPPPPRPSDNQSSKISELEAKIRQFEAELKASKSKEAGASQAELDVMRNEAQAFQLRISNLENTVSSLQTALTEKGSVALALGQFKGELEVLSGRMKSAEETFRVHAQEEKDGALYERGLKKLEDAMVEEIKDRFSSRETLFADISRKANLAYETAFGSVRRIEKLEERTARLSYLETRSESNERKLEHLYDLEALVQALKVSVDGAENNVASACRDTAVVSAENEKLRSDLETISHQVKQLNALFNHFRSELAFLVPKKVGHSGDGK